MKYDDIVDFVYEAGLQKHVKRSGWWVAGIKDPETIGEHSQRASLLAYIISKLEGAEAYKAAVMCTIHDIAECRINDGHRITAGYLNLSEAEDNAFNDQTKLFPEFIKNDLRQLWSEFKEKKSKEAIIAKDADYLECAFQAKEYYDIGYKSTTDWIKNIESKLVTKSAKEIFKTMKKRDSKIWYPKLKSKKD